MYNVFLDFLNLTEVKFAHKTCTLKKGINSEGKEKLLYMRMVVKEQMQTSGYSQN